MTTELKPAWSQSVYINRQHKSWYRFLLNRRLNFAVKALRPYQPHSLLDIGTGPGNSLGILSSGLNLQLAIGLDRTESFLKHRDPTNWRGYVCGDIRRLPFNPGSFDCITLISCAKHLFGLPDALEQCSFTVNAHGLILIIEPSTFILKFAAWLGYFDRRNIPNLLTCREYNRYLFNGGFAPIAHGHFLFGCYQFNLTRARSLPS